MNFSGARLIWLVAALVSWATPIQAQLALPFSATVLLLNSGQTASYLVDLSTLPTRPVLVVEGFPDSTHPDLEIELEIVNFVIDGGPGWCPSPTASTVSTPAVGPNEVRFDLFNCDPRPGAFGVGETVEVRVRISNFGSTGAPASVDVLIRGETLPATNTLLVEFVPTFDTQVVSLLASKDTSIFQQSVGASNGAGELLAVGTVFEGTFFPKTYETRSLLAFDLLGPVPQTATIDDVEIRLGVVSLTGAGDWVGIHRVAPDIGSSPVIWEEGDADVAAGRGAEISSVPAANWQYRESPNRLWAIGGGDPVGSLSTPLDQLKVTKAGVTAIFESSALTTVVADMVASAEDREGFLLAEVAGSMTGSEDRAVQFASRDEQISGVFQPEMIVTFTPTEPYQEGTVETGAVSFVGEGEDFRWIYDLDFDDILLTEIGGICTVLPHNASAGNYLPYSYQFTGDAGYIGLDCCTWNIDAPQTGTVGTGQALFFHNLSASDPDNLPPDTDGDGIHDNCDNCIYTPNGPLLGTCLTGPSAGSLCHSDQECAGGGCGMSQQDADGDFEGDACEVPEPGFGLMLALGSLALMVGKKFK